MRIYIYIIYVVTYYYYSIFPCLCVFYDVTNINLALALDCCN